MLTYKLTAIIAILASTSIATASSVEEQESTHKARNIIPHHNVFTGIDCKVEKVLPRDKINDVHITVNNARLRILPSFDDKIHIQTYGDDEILKNIAFKVVLRRFKFKDKNILQIANSNSRYEMVIQIGPNVPLVIHANSGKVSVNDWYSNINICARNNAHISLTDIFSEIVLSAWDESIVRVDGLASNACIDARHDSKISLNKAYANLEEIRDLPARTSNYKHEFIEELNLTIQNKASVKCSNSYLSALKLQLNNGANFSGECDFKNLFITTADEAQVMMRKRYVSSSCYNLVMTTRDTSRVKLDVNVSDATIHAHDKSSVNVGKIGFVREIKKLDESTIIIGP